MSDKFSVLEELVDELIGRVSDLEQERTQLRERLRKMEERMKSDEGNERVRSLESENRRLSQDRDLIRSKVREMIRRIEILSPEDLGEAEEASV